MGVEALAIAGIATSLVGTGLQALSGIQTADAMKDRLKLEQKQADLEASRGRRDRIREIIVAQAQAQSAATSQGASSSSALQGGLSQIAGAGARNVLAINQDQEIGRKITKTGFDYANAQTLGYLGAGFESLGSSLFNVSGFPLFKTA